MGRSLIEAEPSSSRSQAPAWERGLGGLLPPIILLSADIVPTVA
jgi:hypothetical protein